MTRHCELTRKLGSRGAHRGYKTCRVDNTSTGMQALRLVRWVFAHCEYRILAPPPDPFGIDLHSQIPDALLCVECIVVGRMHYS